MLINGIHTKEKTEDIMIKGTSRYISILFLIFFTVSCGRNVVFTDSVAMKGKTWKISDIPVFKIPVKDTVNSNNIYFIIRTGSSYSYRNIYIFVTTTAPDGKSITDTLRYDLSDEKGNWYGKGFGDIHELKLPYKSNVFFPVSGTYLIKIQHGMRIEDLKGVYDFGLRVDKNLK
jgi:gliding motility-associated lipoprotein GldH